ncbi:MAG TPA: HlyD family efflux transporter periplasmic adaptor subunit [Azospirillaceae bacterium]|nr:HlyD family efflux transporter periplasmic adaptor subunit [Azospirillaceae bacterium]
MLMLFRQESIDHRRRRLFGEVVLSQPVRHGLLTLFLGGTIAVALAWMAAGTFSWTQSSPGFVVPAAGMAQVHAARGGTVERVLVREGERVAAGQPLLRISLDVSGAGGSIPARLRQEMEGRLAELDLQERTAGERQAQDRRRIEDRLAGIGAELARLDERLAGERELQRMADEEERRWAALAAAGNATRTDHARRRQQALGQANVVAELERQRAARETDRRDAENTLAALPLQLEERLSQLRAVRADLAKALTELELSAGYVLTAPISGRIAALQATEGQAAAPALSLVAIVPDGEAGTGAVEAHLLVPSRSAGLVTPGQTVRLRVDAFPYQRFGFVEGRVAQVSRTAYRPGELLAPVPFSEPVYRVVVALDRGTVEAYGKRRDLMPGMTLSADIIVDRRSFLDWLLDPLRAARLRTS